MGAHKSYAMYGKSKTLSEWSKLYGMPEQIVSHRVLYHGWELQKALTTPVRERRYHKDKYRELAEKNGIRVGTYKKRVRDGWDREEAATTPTKWTWKKYRKAEEEEKKARDDALFATLQFVWDQLTVEQKERLVGMIRVAARMWEQEEAS